jgi:hypothetical protein
VLEARGFHHSQFSCRIFISPSTSYGDRNSQNKTEKKPRYGFVVLSQGCQPLHMRPTGRQVLAADTKSAALTR